MVSGSIAAVPDCRRGGGFIFGVRRGAFQARLRVLFSRDKPLIVLDGIIAGFAINALYVLETI